VTAFDWRSMGDASRKTVLQAARAVFEEERKRFIQAKHALQRTRKNVAAASAKRPAKAAAVVQHAAYDSRRGSFGSRRAERQQTSPDEAAGLSHPHSTPQQPAQALSAAADDQQLCSTGAVTDADEAAPHAEPTSTQPQPTAAAGQPQQQCEVEPAEPEQEPLEPQYSMSDNDNKTQEEEEPSLLVQLLLLPATASVAADDDERSPPPAAEAATPASPPPPPPPPAATAAAAPAGIEAASSSSEQRQHLDEQRPVSTDVVVSAPLTTVRLRDCLMREACRSWSDGADADYELW